MLYKLREVLIRFFDSIWDRLFFVLLGQVDERNLQLTFYFRKDLTFNCVDLESDKAAYTVYEISTINGLIQRYYDNNRDILELWLIIGEGKDSSTILFESFRCNDLLDSMKAFVASGVWKGWAKKLCPIASKDFFV